MSYYRKGMSERQATYLLWREQAFRIIRAIARRFKVRGATVSVRVNL